MTTPNEKPTPPTAPATPASVTFWVGLDWADKQHCLVLRPTDGRPAQTHWLEHQPQRLDDFFLELHRQQPQAVIGVVLEQARGPVLYSLLKHPFLRLYPVNPRCLADFRNAFKASQAKADPSDADLLCELGGKHHDRLRPLVLEDPATRQLLLLTEHRRELVDQQTALGLQLSAALKSYYPLALDLFGDQLGIPMSLAFLRRWPNLATVQRTKPSVLRAFCYAQGSRSEDRIQERLQLIAQARPLTEDPALIAALQLRVETLVSRLTAGRQALARYDEAITAVFATHAKAKVFASFPAAGPALAPRLAAAFGTLSENFTSAQAMQCWSGVAPVQKQSGQSRVVQFRYARPKFLHQTFVEYARVSVNFCPWARTLFDALKAREWKAHRIYRVLAFKWIRILWRCWKDGVEYDEARYLRSLEKRKVQRYAPLYAPAAKTT